MRGLQICRRRCLLHSLQPHGREPVAARFADSLPRASCCERRSFCTAFASRHLRFSELPVCRVSLDKLNSPNDERERTGSRWVEAVRFCSGESMIFMVNTEWRPCGCPSRGQSSQRSWERIVARTAQRACSARYWKRSARRRVQRARRKGTHSPGEEGRMSRHPATEHSGPDVQAPRRSSDQAPRRPGAARGRFPVPPASAEGRKRRGA